MWSLFWHCCNAVWKKRDSDYAVLFQLLLSLADSQVDLDEIRERIADEKRDDSKQAIDKEWEEEEVTFGADSLDKAAGMLSASLAKGSARIWMSRCTGLILKLRGGPQP